MADADAHDCPLCLEPLDDTERNFKPCKCGYQLCLWCWQDIKEKLNGRCPACRSEYDPDSFQFTAPDAKSLARSRKKKQDAAKNDTPAKRADAPSMPKPGDNARVLQKNLLYVVGLAPSIAKEEVLKRKDYFGKYGKIVKVAVNKKQTPACAYVTFKNDKDAADAIAGMNGREADGRIIRASFGTNKYCGAFLQGLQCTKPNCLYLHMVDSSQHIVTKEELSFINAQTANPNVTAAGPGSAPWYPSNMPNPTVAREKSASKPIVAAPAVKAKPVQNAWAVKSPAVVAAAAPSITPNTQAFPTLTPSKKLVRETSNPSSAPTLNSSTSQVSNATLPQSSKAALSSTQRKPLAVNAALSPSPNVTHKARSGASSTSLNAAVPPASFTGPPPMMSVAGSALSPPPKSRASAAAAAVSSSGGLDQDRSRWDFVQFAARVQRSTGPLPGLKTLEMQQLKRAAAVEKTRFRVSSRSRYAFANGGSVTAPSLSFSGPNAVQSLAVAVAGLSNSGMLLDGSVPPSFAGFGTQSNIDKAFSPQGSPIQTNTSAAAGGWGNAV